MALVYITQNQTHIYAEPGRKSPCDFIVKYQELGKHRRTPKHIHLVVDLFAKRTGNYELTNELLDHIINMICIIKPSTSFPPHLQIFSETDIIKFQGLQPYGEYPVDFLLVVTELIMIQEKTNYPHGVMNLNLFRKFREGADIFTIVSAATFR